MTKRKRLTPAELRRRLEWEYRDVIYNRPSPMVRESVTVGPDRRVVTVRRGRTRWRRVEWRGEHWWEKV